MVFPKWADLSNRRMTGILSLALAVFFLVVGWWPFNPFPRNNVSWLTDNHGLVLEHNSVVFDPKPLPATGQVPNPLPGFTVELSFEPAAEFITVGRLRTWSFASGSRRFSCAFQDLDEAFER